MSTRREFLSSATVLAAVAGATALQIRLPTKREILQNKDTLTLEEANSLYPQVAFSFSPVEPAINQRLYKHALKDFLPNLPENNALVFKFSDIQDLGTFQLQYELRAYEVDYTKDRGDLLPFAATNIVGDYQPNADPRNVLAQMSTYIFLRFLSGFEIIKKHGLKSELLDPHVKIANTWANENGWLFKFNNYPPSLALQALSPNHKLNHIPLAHTIFLSL